MGRRCTPQLPAAVKAFFDNGGVRCYAVRVTGPDPATGRWALPGVQIWQQDGTVGDVLVEAAWPGSWSAGLRVGTTPIARPLAADAEYQRAAAATPGRLDLRSLGAAATVQPGDLLDLDLGPGRPRLYVRAGSAAESVVTTDAELTYLPAADGSPPQFDIPDPDALGGLPPLLSGVSVGLLRMDLVVQRLTEGQLLLVERFPDLAYASFSTVLQPARDTPPRPQQPALDRSMDLRASAANDQVGCRTDRSGGRPDARPAAGRRRREAGCV